MPHRSRRSFLRASLATAAAGGLQVFPASIQRALAIPAHRRTGTIKDVEHVVILMQENRSFDHYFGTLPGVRGFGDRFGIPLAAGRSVLQQLNAKGQPVWPYHLDQTRGNAQRVLGTPHSWLDARDAWDKGRMDQWPRFKTTASMGYYTEQELPFQFALANAFTICDAYFCSLHGGTNTNRLFHMTGTNGAGTPAGHVVVNNAWDALRLKPVEGDPAPDGGFNWSTYPERLHKAGVSWMVYQNMPHNFTDNPLSCFQQYRRANLASGRPVYHDVPDNPAYKASRDDAGNPLYRGIANTMPDGGLLGSFKADVQAGRLPQVSWIVAPPVYSEHPGPSSPAQGAWYIQEVLDALTANPEVWSKTVLLVNFDENDGYFDHLPPPCAPSLKGLDPAQAHGKTTLPAAEMALEYFLHPTVPGTTMPPADGDCYGPGPRVPMFVISPWSRGGWVNSQAFDHTSVLRFLEARFGVAETQISPFRRAVFGDLSTAFNFATPNDEPLPTLPGRQSRQAADALRKAQEALAQLAPPSPQSAPRQPTGVRPSRALPYELHVSATQQAAAQRLALRFANTGTQAAVFHVYDRLHLDRVPQRYMVERGKQLDDHWDLTDDAGRYDLWVLGPNGFHRHFSGELARAQAAGAPVPEIEIELRLDRARSQLQLRVLNAGAVPAHIEVQDQAYGIAGPDGSTGPWPAQVGAAASVALQWELSRSGGWYDFALRCAELPGFERRFAGRLETGRHGWSDPAMGMGMGMGRRGLIRA